MTTLEPQSEDEMIVKAAEAYGWTAPRDHPYAYLLARDDREDDALAAGLTRSGFAVLRMPLFETAPGRDAEKLARAIASLSGGTAVAWTSRRAAETLVERVLPDERAALSRLPLFALGARSAEPVAREGIAVTVPAGPARAGGDDLGSAAGLAEFIAARANADRIERVLFLAGNRSLLDFPEALAAHGIPVEALEVYATRFLTPNTDALEEAMAERRLACVVFFSPSGAEALEAALPPEHVRALRRIPVAAKGPVTAAALRARGYRSVDAGLRTVAPRPSHPLAFLALHLMRESPR